MYKERCLPYNEDGTAGGPVHLVIGHAGAGLCFNTAPQWPNFWERVELTHVYMRVAANGTDLHCEVGLHLVMSVPFVSDYQEQVCCFCYFVSIPTVSYLGMWVLGIAVYGFEVTLHVNTVCKIQQMQHLHEQLLPDASRSLQKCMLC